MKTVSKFTLIILASLAISYSPLAQNKTWDGGAGDGLWSSAANWDADVLPGAGSHIRINGGVTVNMDVDATVASILQLGTSGSAGTLIIDAGVTLTTTNRGVRLFDASSSFQISGTYAVTHADAGYSGIRADDGSSITINSGGIVTMDDITSVYAISLNDASATLTNNGSITLTNVLVQGGINILNGTMTNNGSVYFSEIGGDNALQGDITNSSTGSIIGTGTNSTGTILNDVTIAGGTLSPNGASAVGQLSFENALNMTGTTTYTAEVANNTGTLTSDHLYFYAGASSAFDISDLDVTVSDIGGTNLALGNSFTIVDSQFGYTGTFNSIDTSAPTLPANTEWEVSYNTNTVTIEVIATLPVELRYFKGSVNDHSISLDWQTESEINNDYFEIERSQDAHSWETIARIGGNGTINTTSQYAFIDLHPSHGHNYYRLKQVDFDGQFEYHSVIYIPFNDLNQQRAFPNPSNGNFTFTNQLLSPEEPIQVFALGGRLLFERFVENQKLDLTDLPRGTYLLKARDTSLKVFIE